MLDLLESEFQGLVSPIPPPSAQVDPQCHPILPSSFLFLNSPKFVPSLHFKYLYSNPDLMLSSVMISEMWCGAVGIEIDLSKM